MWGKNTNMAKNFQIKNDKHKDSYVYTDNRVQLLHKVTLEYKVFTWVLSKISQNM